MTMTALVTLLRFLGWTVCLASLQIAMIAIKAPISRRLPMVWHRGCCRIFGFRIEQHGKLLRHKPTLYVCNHTSYLDINLLGAVIPGCFVAKAEVRRWPLLGFLSTLQRTVFVERRASRTAHHRDEMTSRLEAGDSLILFPEGTSNDGNRVLPFKSAFFAIAENPINGEPLQVQPVSISYTRLDGIPIGRRYRPYFAWYGDMELMSHLWTVAGFGRITVVIEYHQPMTVADCGSRKALAKACEAAIAAGVSQAISGKLAPPLKKRLWAPKPA